jgi:hypothetical protein
MMEYPHNELTDMHYVYGLADGNAAEARRIYSERYPRRDLPCERTFSRIHQRLQETGSFGRQTADVGRPRTVRTAELEDRVLQHVANDPSASTRRIAAREGVSGHATVWRILHQNLLYPYHLQRVQGLAEADFPPRRALCVRLRRASADTPGFLASVLFTDEAGFTRDGVFNYHNTHIWDHINPHGIRLAKHQQQFRLNVWAGVVGDHLLGPVFLPPRLNAANYDHFLQHDLPELLDDIPLAVVARIHYMHDGAPAHFSLRARRYLDERFPGRWIGRAGPIPWPARSPDLNPLDFHLWGHLKALVYSRPVPDVDVLRQRIEDGFVQIRAMPGVFGRVRQSMERRLNACIEAEGGHFEHLL